MSVCEQTSLDDDQLILIKANEHLVKDLAEKYVVFGVPLVELTQEAKIGLSISAKKYDPEKGMPFSQFAQWWIKRKLSDIILSRRAA